MNVGANLHYIWHGGCNHLYVVGRDCVYMPTMLYGTHKLSFFRLESYVLHYRIRLIVWIIRVVWELANHHITGVAP